MDKYSFFNIPDECYIGTTIYKKHFYDNPTLFSSDKMLFRNTINKLTWLYCLKPDLINIAAYKDDERDYPELEVIQVSLNKDYKLDRLADVIMRTIPYPMILIFELDNNYKIYAAHQRISQKDGSKNILDDFIVTDWLGANNKLFEALDIMKMSFSNFYSLYNDIIDAISIYNLTKVINKKVSIRGEEARALLQQNIDIDNEIVSLRSRLRYETQFNRQMELNIAIKKLLKKKEEFLEGIK